MAEEIKRVEYYSTTIANKLGEGSRVLGALCGSGVDLTALWGYPLKGKVVQVDLVPADAGLLKKAAKKAGLALAKHAAVLVQGDDQPGAVAGTLGKLAAAGIKVRAAQALSSGTGRYSLMIQLDDEGATKAAVKALTVVAKAPAAAPPAAPAKKKTAAKK